MAMVDFLKGRGTSSGELPHQISEFCMAREFGWSLEYIRSLQLGDYNLMVELLAAYYAVKRSEPRGIF